MIINIKVTTVRLSRNYINIEKDTPRELDTEFTSTSGIIIRLN